MCSAIILKIDFSRLRILIENIVKFTLHKTKPPMKKSISLLLACIFVSASVFAVDLYWINGTGNWSDNSHWSLTSGGPSCNCLPTTADNVNFDSNSFNAGDSLQISAPAYCKNFNYTDADAILIYGGADIQIHESLNLSTTLTSPFTGRLLFYGTSGTLTTSRTVLHSAIEFNNPTGEWSLADSLTTTQTLTLTKGTFRTNSNDLNASRLISSGNYSRTLELGNSDIVLSGDNYLNQVIEFLGYNFVFNAGQSLITIPYQRASITVIKNQTFYDMKFTNSNGEYQHNIVGPSSLDTVNFHNIEFSNNTFSSPVLSVNNITFKGGKYYQFPLVILSGNIYANSNCGSYVEIAMGDFYKTSGTVIIDYVQLTNSHASGGATFIANNSFNGYNNNGWMINSPVTQTYYWIGGKGSWTDPSHWSLSSGGLSSGCFPVWTDDVVFDSNSFQNPGDTVFISRLHNYFYIKCRNMTWLNVNHQPVLNEGLWVYGSLTLSSSMKVCAINGAPHVSFTFASSVRGNTITTAGNYLGGLNFTGVDHGGEWMLLDSVHCTLVTHSRGHLNTNSQYINVGGFTSENAEMGDSLTLGNSTIDITGANNSGMGGSNGNFNIDSDSLVVEQANSLVRFSGSNGTMKNGIHDMIDVEFLLGTGIGKIVSDPSVITHFHNITFVQSGDINGNCILNDLNLVSGESYKLHDNNTLQVTGNFSVPSTPNGYIQIFSNTDTSYLNIEGDTLCFDYLIIHNVHSTGAVLYAGANSVDWGNTDGWIFQPCPLPVVVLDEQTVSNSINIQPTLIDNYINVSIADDDISEIQFINTAGQEVLSKKINTTGEYIIDTVDWNSGLYIASFKSRSNSVVKPVKVMKM